MPWDVFNLSSDASERELKRAYAKLLKEHRPDKDPEGFARINEAYRRAKMEIAWRSEEAPPIPEELAPPEQPLGEVSVAPFEDELEAIPFVPVSTELPEKFEALRDELRQEIAADDPFGVERVLKEFNQVCVERPDLIAEWGRAIESDFTANYRVLGLSMPQEDLLRELEYGEAYVCNVVLSACEDSYDIDAALKLSEAITGQPERYDSAEAAYVCLRLARLLALVFPTAASSLANHVFETLPPQQRGWQFDQIEQLLDMSGYFSSLREKDQRFWGARLLSPEPGWNWETEESKEALEGLGGMGAAWGGFALLEDIIPEHELQRLTKGGELRRMGLREEVETPTLDSVDRSDNNWGCLVLLPIYIFIKVLILDGCDSDDPPRPQFDGDQYRFESFEEKKRKGELRKIKELMDEAERRNSEGPTIE